ncbi:MAG TPA: hypothetical protein PLS22_13265 [Aquabacterium sp.]|nr:hypothetical protein [Aquabacterium sp.]
MRLFNVGRVALSVVALSVLTACGGGGDDGPDYPADGQIVISSSAPDGAPVGTYYTANADSDAYEDGGLEIATIDFEEFLAEVVFLQEDPRKYVIFFEDMSDDDYSCRSAALSVEEQQSWNPFVPPLPVCASTLEIDAARHQLRASNFTIRGSENTNNRVTFSANVSWTLGEVPR